MRDLGIDTAMHRRTPAELKAELDAEHTGTPFLVFRVADGQVVRALPEEGRLTLGREEACDFSFADDHEVSRLHCELERVGGHWVLADHGLSRNGTFLNGERLHGERALHDGDTIRLGTTSLTYRAPGERTDRETRPAAESQVAEALTPTQRAVLSRALPPVPGRQPVRDPGVQPGDRRRGRAQRPAREGAPARPLRAARRRGPAPQRQAHQARRGRVPVGCRDR